MLAVTTEPGIREVSEQTGLSIDTLGQAHTNGEWIELAQLHEDLAVIQGKTADYRRLIALGLDCEDEGTTDAVA